LSAPLAFAGEEFVNLFNKEAGDPEDDFDFGEHDGDGSVGVKVLLFRRAG